MKKLFYPLMLLLSLHAYGQDLYYTHHGKKIPLKADSSIVYVEFENSQAAGSYYQKFAATKTVSGKAATLFASKGVMFEDAMNQFWNKAASKEKEVLFAAPVLRTEKSQVILRPMIVLELKGKEGSLDPVLRKYSLKGSPYELLGPGMYRITYSGKSYRELLNLCNRIAADNNLVNFCQPDFYSDIKPDRGPLYPAQFYLNNTGQQWGTPGIDIRAEGAWQITTGAGTTRVAVIDAGMDAHEDYAGRLLSGYTAGYPLATGAPQNIGPSPAAHKAHGVAVSGIIGATHNNALGIRGVSSNALLIPVNIFPNTPTMHPTLPDVVINHGSVSDAEVAAAINWAYSPSGGAADILNCSWSMNGHSAPVESAINNAMTYGRGGLGSIVVASAGNAWPTATDVAFPANMNGVIAVGACDGNGNISGYSQRGASLDVVAPSNDAFGGFSVVTTDRMGAIGYDPGHYTTTFGGTSAAAPQISGIAALILAINPNLTLAQIRTLIQNTATDMGIPGFDNTFGFGRANACRAVEQAVMASQNISGPDLFCTSGNYNVTLPPGFTMQGWSVSPALATVTPSGTTATLTKITDGGVTLTATLNSPCGGTVTIDKVISVGVPVLNTVYLENLNYPGSICYTDAFNMGYPYLFAGSQADHFNVTVTPPTGGVSNFTAIGTEFVVPVRRPGTHTISVTPVNSCGNGTPIVFEFDAIDCSFSARSAKQSGSQSGMIVSPNPANQTAIITFNNADERPVKQIAANSPLEIRVLDIHGAVRLTKRVAAGSNNIPLEIQSLPAGVYIVEARNGVAFQTAKLLITR